MTLRLVRLDYSVDPWRIVTADGVQLTRWVEHWDGEMPSFVEPLAFGTKQAAIDWLLAQLDRPCEWCQHCWSCGLDNGQHTSTCWAVNR